MNITDTKDFLTSHSYELYESTTMPFTNKTISHFALTDSLLRYVGKYKKNSLHFWPTSNLVILGMMDTKLPYFKDALEVIKNYNHSFIVRNSGGLAVVGDEGVLNFSLILPEDTQQKMPINTGYDYMLQLINETIKPFGKISEAYEIKNSYCPGDFDLSIDGKKFAGISQRRLKNGVAIMIYISVNGNQEKRAKMIRDFYQAGLKGETVKWHFPSVDPAVMATLEELLSISLTVEEMKQLILDTLLQKNCTISPGNYSSELLADYNEGFEKMVHRNQQMLGNSIDKELIE